MTSGGHIVFLPGEVSIDVFDSLKMAFEKLRPRSDRLERTGTYIRSKRERINDRLAAVPRPAPTRFYPVRYVNNPSQTVASKNETKKEKAARVRRELIDVGITIWGLMKSESRTLPKVLHDNERVEAVVYGQHHNSSVMLVATDERIIFLDRKPMALFLDEVSYEVVSGIQFEIHVLFATLILHTPVRNYDIHYANLHCAEKFARHIEARRLHREKEEQNGESNAPAGQVVRLIRPRAVEPLDDMAGYYWLPTEEEEKLR